MANANMGSKLNKSAFKHRKVMSNLYFGCSQEYKKSTEQYTMTYSEYKKKWLKEKRRNSNGHR